MNSKNYTQVLIDGKIYTLGGKEEESYLQKVASYISEKISRMKKQEGFLRQSPDYQTIMVELNIADDYFKAQQQATFLEKDKTAIEKDVYSLKHELVTTQMKLEAALKLAADRQGQIEELKQQLKAAKTEDK